MQKYLQLEYWIWEQINCNGEVRNHAKCSYLSALRNKDVLRLKNAAKKISIKYKKRRKSLNYDKKSLNHDSSAYKAGGFGLGVEPALPRKRRAATGQGSKPQSYQKSQIGSPKIMFIDERYIRPTYYNLLLIGLLW